MKIGVSGASGHLGRAVVSEVLQRPGGHEVVAIRRTPETVSAPAQGRFGDYNRPESLAKAYMRASIACSSSRPSIRNLESAGRKTSLPSVRRPSPTSTRNLIVAIGVCLPVLPRVWARCEETS
jgi:putative NADH-flavin reductase